MLWEDDRLTDRFLNRLDLHLFARLCVLVCYGTFLTVLNIGYYLGRINIAKLQVLQYLDVGAAIVAVITLKLLSKVNRVETGKTDK